MIFIVMIILLYLFMVGTIATYAWIFGSGAIMLYVSIRTIFAVKGKFVHPWMIIPVGALIFFICAIIWLFVASSIL